MGIVTVILGLASKLIGIFWPSKSAEKVARDDGLDAGISAQQSADYKGELDAAKAAQNARSGVSANPSQLLHDPANAGPERS